MNLILASTSPYRKALLERLGIPFRVENPPVDEDDWKQKGLLPEELALTLAIEKARTVASDNLESLVIGSDQLAVLEGTILGKPGSRKRAIEQLSRLAGKTHRLFTAVCVRHGSRERVIQDAVSLRMRQLDRAAIERYVDFDEPFDCAGSYKIESRGICLFEQIDCADATAIEGLPLLALSHLLREFGCDFP